MAGFMDVGRGLIGRFTQPECDSISTSRRETAHGNPLIPVRVETTTELNAGDHIVYRISHAPCRPSFRSALVTSVDTQDDSIEIITNKEPPEGVSQEKKALCSFKDLYIIPYDAQCRYSLEESIERARKRLALKENHYHALNNNSHFFVTWAKTGRENPLTEIIQFLSIEDFGVLDPVLTKLPIHSVDEIQPGDHVIVKGQHWLIKTAKHCEKKCSSITIEGYTCSSNPLHNFCVLEKKNVSLDMLFKIDYNGYDSLYEPDKSLQLAHTSLTNEVKWDRSDKFVCAMKCGRRYSFDEDYLLHADVQAVSATRITPYVSIDEGDHLVVRGEIDNFSSFVVCKCIDTNEVEVMPSPDGTDLSGRLQFNETTEAHRINYNQCLPAPEVMKRASSSEGKILLQSRDCDSHGYVSWVKTGKQLYIDVHDVIKKQQIKHISPTYYTRILSTDEIEVGDHLFADYRAINWHFLVIERAVNENSSKFRIIYCKQLEPVQETVEEIKVDTNPIYKIVYTEEFPPKMVIERARKKLGTRDLNPYAPASFILNAKTGSEKGLEVDFLVNYSMPVTKSRIQCFTQLNPGDYLIGNPGKMHFDHHCLVISVESPVCCTVIESLQTNKVTQSSLQLNPKGIYYRINYNSYDVCIPADVSIEWAKNQIGKRLLLLRSKKCVSYAKSGERKPVESGDYPDDRLFIQRQKVLSANELMVGDHIEIPLSNTIMRRSAKAVEAVSGINRIRHHMLVRKKIDDKRCMVTHFKDKQITTEELDIFKEGCDNIYRVMYTERIDLETGISNIDTTRRKKFALFANNCEHLVLYATVGDPISVQVSEGVHKGLQKAGDATKNTIVNHGSVQITKISTISSLSSIKSRPTVFISKSIFRLGFRSALKHTTIAVVGGGVTFGIDVLIEAPILGARIYKLHRKKKLNVITKTEQKQGIVKEVTKSSSVVVGGVVGTAIGGSIGSVAMPGVGTAVGGIAGGLVGSLAGNLVGNVQGSLAAMLVPNKEVTLVRLDNPSYSDF